MSLEKRTVIAIVLIITIISLSAIVLGALVTTYRISNIGTIKATVGLGVYLDSACTKPVTSIDWNTLSPGQTQTITVYIRNEGTVTMTLSMKTENWQPTTASNYITLNWNREGYSLNASLVLQAVFTLSVSSSITGITNFSFDIVITGST